MVCRQSYQSTDQEQVCCRVLESCGGRSDIAQARAVEEASGRKREVEIGSSVA